MDTETVLKISRNIWPYSANSALSPEMYAFASAIEEYARKDEREKCIGLAQQQLSEYPAHSYNDGVMACIDALKEIGRGL